MTKFELRKEARKIALDLFRLKYPEGVLASERSSTEGNTERVTFFWGNLSEDGKNISLREDNIFVSWAYLLPESRHDLRMLYPQASEDEIAEMYSLVKEED